MTDLAQIIKERITITEMAERCGYAVQRNGFVLSPYHQERTASCKLYSDNNSFFDFSSNQGGSVIDFWMALYNVEFKQAIKEIAEVFGLISPTSDVRRPGQVPAKPVRPKEENIFECMNIIEREVYEEHAAIADEKQAFKEVRLLRLEQNKEIFKDLYQYCIGRGFTQECCDYLLSERHLTPKTISNFKIFQIRNYYEVQNHLKKNFSMRCLQSAGLFNRKEGEGEESGNLIFFKHTLIIPYIFNDEIVYLRGRYFAEGSAAAPDGASKYLGLRNDALNVNTLKRFFNRDVMRTMLSGERLYIVEGEFDAMVMTDHGYNAIGIPGIGNSPSAEKFHLLKSFKVIAVPDSDEAGSKLAAHLQKIFNERGMELFVKKIPAKDVTELAGVRV